MPTYDYACEKCDHHFSLVETIHEHDRRRPKCPACKSTSVKRVFTPFYAKTVRKS